MVKSVQLDKILEILKTDEVFEICSAGLLDLNSTYITDITAHSMQVIKGSLFVALEGALHNGEDYIPAAIKQGASSILARPEVCQELADAFPGTRFLSVSNPRVYIGKLAGLFYPAVPGTLVAVTGTNGKSSVVDFVRQFWAVLGHSAASVGTLGVVREGHKTQPGLTTLDPIDLRKTLHKLAADKVTHVALEASSHGLDQYRLEGLKFQAAGFTNLTQDHLDYHKTFKNYLMAKARLFERHLKAEGIGVLNADTPEFNAIEAACGAHEVLTFGKSGRDFNVKYVEPTATGQKISVSFFEESFHFFVPLVGRFQVMNVLCALGMVAACVPEIERLTVLRRLIEKMDDLASVPGRMEKVGVYKEAGIYVDFAHTPHALRVALEALKHHVKGALWVVFGCGGNRDSAKRGMMGEIAERYADQVVVTDDNPRFEQPEFIRRAIMAACPEATEIGDRQEAIHWAIEQLAPGDILLVAGKGHEEGQIVGDTVLPFSDQAVITDFLTGKDA